MTEPELPSSGSWIRIALISGLLFGIPMGIFYSLQSGRLAIGIPSGIAAGLLFGPCFTWLMKRFAQRQTHRFQTVRPDFGTESVLMEGPANHFKGLEGVGGYLWITDKRVHFASHSFNVQNHVWTASLSEVRDVQAVKTLGLIDNGLSITTDTAGNHRFVLNNSTRWADVIRQHLPAPS